MNKKLLYKNIMESLSKTLGKTLNESFQSDEELRDIVLKLKRNVNAENFYNVAFPNEEINPSLQKVMGVYDPYVEDIIEIIYNPASRIYEICDNIKEAAENNEWDNGTESDTVVNFLYDLYDWCEQQGLVNEEDINESKVFEGEVPVHTFEPEFDEVIEHVKNGTVNTDKDSEILFDALVPGSGHADSVGGEILRAAERIGYRYYNDGDKAGEGYGRETVNPAVRYLMFAVRPATLNNPLYRIVKDFHKCVDNGYCDINDKEYEFMIKRLLRYTVIHIVENKLWDIPNQKDMFDFRDPEVDVDRDEWEDEEY